MRGSHTLSVSCILKNEGATIYRALSSIKADEFIIGVDSSTTDNTREELKRFGVDWYEFEWENDFSKARNENFDRCSGDYIFILDGHEYVNGEIPELGEFGVYLAEIWMGNSAFEQERIFRKGYKMANACHNVLVYDCLPAKIPLRIVHARSEKLIEERFAQRQEMNFSDLKKRAETDNHALLQLAHEYFAHKRFRNALNYYIAFLGSVIPDRQRYQIYLKIGLCYHFLKMDDEAEHFFIDAETYNIEKRNEHLVFLAALYEKRKDYDKAIEYSMRAVTIPMPKNFYFLYPKFYHSVPNQIIGRINDKN